MATPRILMLSNRIPYPLRDGGALAIHAMLEGYVAQGFEVHMFAMNTSRHYVELASLPALYKHIHFTTFEIDTDIRIFPVLKNFVLSKNPNHAERFYNKGYEEKLTAIISDIEPDFIQLESIFLATYIPLIRSLSKAKIIIRLHNIEYQIWERLAAGYNYSLRRYYFKNLSGRMRQFEQAAWQNADLLLPISAADIAVVREAGIDTPSLLVPFGVMPQHSVMPDNSSITEGYHLGAMDWMPNADGIKWFIEQVWPQLHKVLPQFRFSYAGRAMPPAFVRLQGDGVTNAGEVPDAGGFIVDKKILVVPLLSGSGIRVKVLEAMAAHKLVVSTALGMQGITEAKPCVHYLQAETPEEFINAISWAVNNEAEAQKTIEAGSDLVAMHYNQQSIIENLVSTLRRITSK